MNETIISNISEVISQELPSTRSSFAPTFIDKIPIVGPILSGIINFLAGLSTKAQDSLGGSFFTWMFIIVTIYIGFKVIKKVIGK